MSFSKASVKLRAKPFKPEPYQIESTNWILKTLVNGLFLKPGLGKTAAVLNAFKLLKEHGYVKKLFVIAPIRVVDNVWPNEIKKWKEFNHFTYTILQGPKKNKALENDTDIYIMNVESLKWLLTKIKDKSVKFKNNDYYLCIDESSNFKNYSSKRSKIMKTIAGHFKRRTILTGSPAPNGLLNIWPQVYILDQGQRLGTSLVGFRNNYFTPSGWGGYSYEIREGAEEKIYDAISDIVIHKSQKELDLPPLLENKLTVSLPTEARRIYEEMRGELITELENGDLLIANNAATASGKLRQIANGGGYTDEGTIATIHEEKTKAALELKESIEGRPLFIAYEFDHDLERLKATFPNAEVLKGKMKRSETTRIINSWNANKIQVLLVQPQAAGHGLNLQESDCEDVCWYSMPWDFEIYEQLNARVHRKGVKTDRVTIHHIMGENTIDENIYYVLQNKRKIQDALLAALEK